MSGEFPEKESDFFVMETNRLGGGGSISHFAAGPFEQPDQARQARDSIRETEPTRCVHCVEVVNCEVGAA